MSLLCSQLAPMPPSGQCRFKATLINSFYISNGWNYSVIWKACSDKLQRIINWLWGPPCSMQFLSFFKLIVFSKSALINSVFRKKVLINLLYTLSKQQTDTVSNQLVNTVEHLAAKEPDIFLRSWWRPKLSWKDSEYRSAWMPMLLRVCWMCKPVNCFLMG